MKIRRTNASTVDTQFDEWAKAVAHGLTRRKIIQVLGGGITGALVALRGQKAWADPSPIPPGPQGCGHICAALFNPQNQGAFAACTQACEDCKSCQGIPTMMTTQVLVCTNATPCRNGGGLACCSGGQNCCGGVCCNADCCGGQCLPACPAGFQRDPSTCQCVSSGSNVLTCGCSDGTSLPGFCVQPSCDDITALVALCRPVCPPGSLVTSVSCATNACVS